MVVNMQMAIVLTRVLQAHLRLKRLSLAERILTIQVHLRCLHNLLHPLVCHRLQVRLNIIIIPVHLTSTYPALLNLLLNHSPHHLKVLTEQITRLWEGWAQLVDLRPVITN